MTTEIFEAQTETQISDCFEAFHALRPHLDLSSFLEQVKRQRAQNYHILGLRYQGKVCSVAGFRYAEFLAWGKLIYIDDLSTLPEARGKGFASQLLQYIFAEAKRQNLDQVHLDSGYARHDAHRLYLKNGMDLAGHHIAVVVAGPDD